MILSQMYAVKENEFIPTELGRETITWNVGIESTVQDAGKGVLTNGAGRMATSLVMTDVEGKATANGTELKVAILRKGVRPMKLTVTDVEGKATANGAELKVAVLQKGVRLRSLSVTDVDWTAPTYGTEHESKGDFAVRKAPPETTVSAPPPANKSLLNDPVKTTQALSVSDHTDAFSLPNVQPEAVEKPKESNAHRLSQRSKQIEFGKNTLGYSRYCKLVPRSSRRKPNPRTPDVHQVCSKRSWDGQVKKWRRALHQYDPPVEDGEEEIPLDLRPYKAQPPPEFIVKAGCLQLSAKESADSFLEDLGIGDKRKQESLEDLEDDYALGQADSHKKQKVDEWDFEDGEISDGDDDAIRDGEMYDEFDVEFV
ncbi:hypothetical protein CYMTET_41371 [Cymbomonas tetramitiformis]|uniref:Histone RNA hairpin-binding protein RNA-binding domain-containing protein n=1 Tax=Cymbomonas tetramitiformis TaxID=36881 RepID=A0AAE0F2L1_9CHLO|nr:hypothetical protein CYMTET_41372 [Cymbomonas tetramitiformis]KAK3249191.1 hypothetical protein CYMTET_41371 [Cymbomonas tetramitiformis]